MLIIMSITTSERFDRIPPLKHAPLDHTKPSIRIIKVLPSLSREGFVQCVLTHGSTADDYTCLSYTWGDESTACPVLVDAQLFLVRQNLHRFSSCRPREVSSEAFLDRRCLHRPE
jgi:hypothetical protein